ncbi:unnamed protein product [Allacma fusca]|uniref:Protein MAK10 homolog n=1 Tax=Allacma fusca TaxID=39272 RepID=A0A8J2LKK9_9HEXA|nr:unnamed protein product [Allacma fusca]
MELETGDRMFANEAEIDITREFLSAVTVLELGELLHDPSFGLFEAMSAIEMMDPKMDAGMICNKGKRVILNFEQSVQAGELKLEGLTDPELIGIMDTTICCLVTWLEGHSLAQTVFTNLYLHSPTSVGDKCLRSFCVATLKIVDMIEECVSKASVFEEEDFQPAVYGYNLATQYNDSKTNSMLREVEDELTKKIKTCSKNCLDTNALNALLLRIKFMRVFYSLLCHIWKRDSNSQETLRLAQSCHDCLTGMEKTYDLGIQRATDEKERFLLGFELLVNQRLLPPTFPRSTQIRSVQETINFLNGLISRIKQVLKIATLSTNFHAVLDFFFTFSETRPCVLSRSILQLLYSPMRFKRPGVEDMLESMKESVRTYISPSVMSSQWKGSSSGLAKEVNECVEMFFDRCAAPFASLLMACGHNRARQRDKLAHLLEDFACLQLETERIDAFIHTLTLKMEIRQHGNCFGNWLLYHISKIMIRYILTGFELELYSVHEFSYIYWYLYEFLYGWLLSSLSRAETLLAEESNSKNKNKANNKKGKFKGNKALNREFFVAQAEQNIAGGIFKAIMGLLIDKRLPLPHSEFDNEAVRYRHRFTAFNSIRTPSPVHYLQYKSIADLSFMQPAVNLYVASARNFHQAKQFLELIPQSAAHEKDVQDLLKIAKTNFVVVKLLASGHTKESGQPPEFDFSAHMHFPIIKIKNSSSAPLLCIRFPLKLIVSTPHFDDHPILPRNNRWVGASHLDCNNWSWGRLATVLSETAASFQRVQKNKQFKLP